VHSIKKFCAFLLVVILFQGCDSHRSLEKIQFTGEAQGTYYAITYFSAGGKDYQASIDSLLDEFDKTASLWVEQSLINQVNNNADVTVNDVFLDLFRISQEVSENTNGYFDVTVGPLVRAWGFGPDNMPDIRPGTVDSLKTLANFNNVEIIKRKVIKSDPRIKFDFNGVAQGYSVDLVSEYLESKGIENYLVDIGGEVYAHGKKPGRKRWRVGIEKPSDYQHSSREINAELPITDRAVATSGNYRKYYEQDGIRYSHTIDPKTGYPVKHSLLSVTVIAEQCAFADAYATAIMAMGLEDALLFIKERQVDLEVYFIYSGENGKYKTLMTEGLKQSLEEVN